MHLVVGDLNISPIVCFKPFGLSCHYLLIVTGLLLEALLYGLIALCLPKSLLSVSAVATSFLSKLSSSRNGLDQSYHNVSNKE